MPTPDEINDAILSNAVGPRSAAKDGENFQQHALQDQIAAAKFVANQESASRGGLGFRLFKFQPRYE